MTNKEALKEARRLFDSSIDLEEGETKQDWIETMAECLLEDSRNTFKK